MREGGREREREEGREGRERERESEPYNKSARKSRIIPTQNALLKVSTCTFVLS